MKKDREFEKEIDYHRYWKDMYEKEHKLRQEAEGEMTIVKGIGENSPEMKALQSRVKELEEINESHRKLNGKLQERLTEVEEDNKKLTHQIEDRINQMRRAGM
jgi:chromosome segregation ATPase